MRIVKTFFPDDFAHRAHAMGLIENNKIEIINQAPFNGPYHIRINNVYDLIIRKDVLEYIELE